MNMKNLLKLLKWSALGMALFGILGTLVGCSTIHGVGEDVQRVGERIQQEVD